MTPGYEQYWDQFIADWGQSPEWIKSDSPKGANVFQRDNSLLYEHVALTHAAK